MIASFEKPQKNLFYSRSSSKCVSMPSVPGTEQMSLAFRKVLHLFTRQQCPPSSFCLRHRRVSPSLTLTSSSCLPPAPKPKWSRPRKQCMLIWKKKHGGMWGGKMVNTVSSYLDSPICGGGSPEPTQYKRTGTTM